MLIESYSFGKIVIAGRQIRNDVLIIGNSVISWWRREGHLLQVEDLAEVWKYAPEVIVIGCGADSVMKVSETVSQKCRENNIELIAVRTHEAVDEFNRISAEKKTACGLHLTC